MDSRGKLAAAFAAVRQRFSDRLDTEHEQALIRVVIGILVLCYFLFLSLYGDLPDRQANARFTWVMAIFIAASVGLVAHIALYREISPKRRLASIFLDIGAVTYFFFNADEHALPLYFLYLWITFGYGFRFGRRYLLIALALALFGFGTAIVVLPYWNSNRFLGVGLWVGMLVVSLYVNMLVGRLTSALQHAEAANQAKRRFISSVSHELRTPLNAIIGMADLLRSTNLSSEQADMVHSLDNASQVMLSLIEDVLDFSKIEAGKLIIENTEFDLHQLVNSTVDVFKYQASQRGLRLIINIDPSVPYALYGDPHHLRQVLVNLLSNAVKFTQKGRIVLRIDALIETSASVQLRFEVEDTGIGIAPQAQAKIFESFTQADESTVRRYGGTGLGTTISKQLVELMGGRIGLQSALGAGSLFWFELELKKQKSDRELHLGDEVNVLLIGFNDAESPYITAMLTQWKVPCNSAPDIDTACFSARQAAQAETPYRLALINGTLVKQARASGISAEDFLEQIIKELCAAAGAELSVVLCGADALDGAAGRAKAESLGLSAILNFPIEKSRLFNAIHAAKSTVSASAEVYPEVYPLSGAAEDGKAPAARYNILVAEDNATNRKVIQKILERSGHYCTLVENGEEALDEIDRHDYDAIVLDMNMPVMSGLEAAKAYRFMRPNDMRVPLIIFSANVTTDVKEECEKAGVDAFLPKPIQVKLFLEVLDKLIQESRRTRKLAAPPRGPSAPALLVQPPGEEIILNYATLAELESIGQDPAFVEELLSSFIQDTELLLTRLEAALLIQRFEEFKEILHAIKGSSVSIGAVAMKTMCQRLEKMTYAELKRDTGEILHDARKIFDQLLGAVETYRKQRKI